MRWPSRAQIGYKTRDRIKACLGPTSPRLEPNRIPRSQLWPQLGPLFFPNMGFPIWTRSGPQYFSTRIRKTRIFIPVSLSTFIILDRLYLDLVRSRRIHTFDTPWYCGRRFFSNFMMQVSNTILLNVLLSSEKVVNLSSAPVLLRATSWSR